MVGIKKSGLGDAPSFSAKYISNRDATPNVSAIMGKGVRSIENNYLWHGKAPSKEQVLQFIDDILKNDTVK